MLRKELENEITDAEVAAHKLAPTQSCVRVPVQLRVVGVRARKLFTILAAISIELTIMPMKTGIRSP